MEYINQLSNIEILRHIGIAAIMAVLIAGSLWLTFKVVTHRKDLEIPLGIGAIATGLASLSIIIFMIPEQYIVSIGIFALMAIMFFIAYSGVAPARKRKAL